MNNLIYQYWDGKMTSGCKAGVESMRAYAKRIGAEYLFEENPRFVTNLGGFSPHFGAFKPIYTDSFHEYDHVLFADTDIFVIEDKTDNIFEEYDTPDVGICTEPFQPAYRKLLKSNICHANDSRWAKLMKSVWDIDVPRLPNGDMKIYNTGVVLYSNQGLKRARERFVPFKEYVDLINKHKLPGFYTCDQPYLHAMLEYAKLDWIEMDNDWNALVHFYYPNGIKDKKKRLVHDPRTPETKFVHIQLSGADHWDASKLWRVTNLPQEDW